MDMAELSTDLFNKISKFAFHNRVKAYSNVNDVITFDEPDLVRIIDQTRREHDMLLSNAEAYMIYSAAKSTNKLPGDMAEVGVYRGGSAKLICKVKGDRPLHLFDTFEGLPCDGGEGSEFKKGMYPADFEEVKAKFANEKNVNLYKGLFPDTAGPIKDKKFSFVHLDVDICSSMVSCLNFFYGGMVTGGVIISHDYGQADIKKAFSEFFKDKPEIVVGLISGQCIVIKT